MESAQPKQAAAPAIRLESRHVVALVALACMGVAAVASFTSIPLLPCLFRMLTHIPCPGCGMTRSIAALVRGDVALSFRYHPLGPPLLLAALACLAMPFLPADRVRELSSRAPRQQTIAWTAFVLLVGVWLVRIAFFVSGNRYFLW